MIISCTFYIASNEVGEIFGWRTGRNLEGNGGVLSLH